MPGGAAAVGRVQVTRLSDRGGNVLPEVVADRRAPTGGAAIPTSVRATTCPVCSTPDARRIVYGLPTGDLLDDPDVALGGCIVGPEAPKHRCRNPGCGAEFGRRR